MNSSALLPRICLRSFALFLTGVAVFLPGARLRAAEGVIITGVPDYNWYAGCFGSASGNLMGYWDRNGFPGFYTGPTGDGVAPLDTFSEANKGIRSMWASKAGFDGRADDQPGHIDDYWDYYLDELAYSYESTSTDPYVLAGRPEHEPDCIGDFTGASQNKWTDLNGECDGNIDAFAVNYWDKSGQPRTNYVPPRMDGLEVRDLQSGFLRWTQFKGRSATVISQLVDFHSGIEPGSGFTFADLKAEINAGYPVMLFLQSSALSRSLPGMPKANPRVHGMVAYGYIEGDDGQQFARYRTSWGSGDNRFSPWGNGVWESGMTLRGVILYRPHPQITHLAREAGQLRIEWDGPASTIGDGSGIEYPVHWYVVEHSESLERPAFAPITEPSIDRTALVPDCCAGTGFFRVALVGRP